MYTQYMNTYTFLQICPDIVCTYGNRKVFCKLLTWLYGHIWQAYSVSSVTDIPLNLKNNHHYPFKVSSKDF